MEAEAPLTARERWIVAGISAAVVVTRVLALARTPWDWDEMLFILAMRDYDVAAHHPHPPGFPLFIAFAKLLRLVVDSDFHALQTIAFLGAAAVFPAMFFFARELRLPFRTSVAAGLLLAFFPNVLVFGGTAFSDVPSMTLVLVACALLLRGRHDGRAYLLGAVVLAIAAGFRPQNLVIGFVPALLATIRQRRLAIPAIVLGAAIVGISYGVAIERTGWERYREVVDAHGRYITATDSFRAPARPPLIRVFDEFFVRPYRQGILNAIVALLVLIGLARMHKGTLIALATFGPFCLFAWLFLDFHSAGRFSIGYMPLLALLAAEGLRRFALSGGVVLAGAMFVWSWPGLHEVRTTPSPPVAAVEWLRTHVDPATTTLYVHRQLLPYVEVLAPRFATISVEGNDAPVPWTVERDAYLLREESVLGVRWPQATALQSRMHDDRAAASGRRTPRTFARPHGRLWDIVRRRYFSVSVTRIDARVAFGDGWYGQEGQTRWMSERSSMQLPAVGGPAKLAFSLHVPSEVRGTTITIAVDGNVIETVEAREAYVDRTLMLNGTRAHEIVITTSRTYEAPGPRRLGLRLEWLVWTTV